MSLTHNERTKLSATFLNGLALTFTGGGFVTPLIAVSYGLPGADARGATAFAIGLAWLSTGLALHWSARIVLGSLKE